MENESIRKIINVDQTNHIPVANFKQEDDAVLLLSLYKNSVELDLTGQTIKLGVKRANNSIVELTDGFLIDKNNIDITLKNNILAVPGIAECDLELSDSTGKMTTASFFITVKKKVLNGESVQATNEFDTFTKTVEKIEEDYNSLKGGLLAEDKVVYFQNEINKTNASLETQAANLQDQVNQTNAHLENIVTQNILNYSDLVSNDDWSLAIQTAINNLKPYDILLIPTGVFKCNNIVLKTGDVFIDCRGKLKQYDTNGTLFTIGSTDISTFRVNGTLNCEKSVDDGVSNTIGLNLINCNECKLEVTLRGFKRNLVLSGINKGCAYNSITTIRNVNGYRGIDFEIDESGVGWVNENKFYNGRFYWTTDYSYISEAILINIPHTSMNNNVFFSPSLESVTTTKQGTFIYCNGQYNTFYSPRLEGNSTRWHFGANSVYNEIIYPYFHADITTSTNILNEGLRNKVFSRDCIDLNSTTIINGGIDVAINTDRTSNLTHPLSVRNTKGDREKAFAIKNSNGSSVVFEVDGLGVATTKTLKSELATFKPSSNAKNVLEVKNATDNLVFGIRGDNQFVGKTKAPAGYNTSFLIPTAIKTTSGKPTSNPLFDDGTTAIGVQVLCPIDSKIYIHMGDGVWKGLSLVD